MPMTAEERQRLERLEAVIGDAWWSPRKDYPTLQAEPRSELPSGDYPLYFRIREIGNAIDWAVEQVAEFRQQLANQPASQPPENQTVDAAAVIAKLATDYNVHFVNGKLGIGMVPEPDAHAQLQLCGERAAILGRANTQGTDGQNPTEVHTNEIHIVDNDGGLRFLQYGFWGKNGFKRNTTNRAFSVVALDSEGDICQSKVAVGADKDGGQLWYIITNFNSKIVQFCTFQTGWQIEILETVSSYSDRLRKRL